MKQPTIEFLMEITDLQGQMARSMATLGIAQTVQGLALVAVIVWVGIRLGPWWVGLVILLGATVLGYGIRAVTGWLLKEDA